MPDSFTIACPSCSLQLRCQPTACGKRLQCPGCQSWMMVPDAPEAEPAEPSIEIVYPLAAPRKRPVVAPQEAFDNLYDLSGCATYAAPQGPRRRKPSRKKPPQRKWVVPTAIAGGSVLGLLLLGAIFYAMAQQFSVATLDVDEPLAYLTVDSEFILVMRANELRNHPAFADEVSRRNMSELNDFAKAVGMDTDDILTIGVSYRDARHEGNVAQALNDGMVVVYEMRKKFNRFRLSLGMTKKRHAGKDYLADRVKTHGVTAAAFFPSETSLVIASEATIKRLLEADRPTLAGSRFAPADFSASIVFAYAPRPGQPRLLTQIGPVQDDSLFIEIKQTAEILTLEPRSLSVCVDVESGVRKTVYAECDDPGHAAQVKNLAMQTAAKRQALAEQMTLAALAGDPQAPATAQRNLQASVNGAVIVISTQFPR